MTDRKFTPPNEGEVREYVTGDGRVARAYFWNEKLHGDIGGHQCLWRKGGRFDPVIESGYDLFDSPKTRDVTVWVSGFKGGDYSTYRCKPDYVNSQTTSLTKHTLTITEGQFDED